MHWLGRYPLCALILSTFACGDDAATADGTGTTGADTTAGTSGDETAGPDETADSLDTTESESDTDDPQPCERNSDCDDGNACTDDVCNSGVCEVGEAVESSECRPQIDVEFPPRAATLDGAEPEITITGTVTSAAAPIAWLRINGVEVPVAADGTFSHDYNTHVGGNTLVMETADTLDAPRKRVQSFLWSPSYRLPTPPDSGMADEGLAVYLDQLTLDDGNHMPPIDDLATLLNVALGTIDIAQFVSATPIATNIGGSGYNILLQNLVYNSTDVVLSSIDGGIHLDGYVYGITGDLVFDCVSPICQIAGDGSGDVSVTSIQVSSDLIVDVDASNQLTVTSSNTQTTVTGLNVTTNNNAFNFLINLIEPVILGGVVAQIEGLLSNQVDTLLGPALEQALNGLAPNSTLALPNLADPMSPIAVDLVTDFYATDFHDGVAPPAGSPPQGGVITLRGGGFAQNVLTPYTNLGIPDRYGCGDGTGLIMPRAGELEVGLTDDLLNQLLHGAWQGGLLEFDMPPELLGSNGLIDDLQIHVSGMLAPTASDCGPDGEVKVHLGDVRIDASLSFSNTPISFTAYSSMLATLEITPTGTGVELNLAEVESIDTELTVGEDNAIGNEELLIVTLESQLVDGVIESIAASGLGVIELPPIDLSPTLGLPPGTAAIEITTTDALRAPGVTVIRGHL